MSIRHFMWGYQPHFRIEQQCDAERLFQALDKGFEPEVFLVGILAEPSADRFKACVEPEDDFWITSEEFDNVLFLAGTLQKRYPEAKMLHSHPLAQQRQDEYLVKRSIRDAIHQTIDTCRSKPKDITFTVSFPARVDCYWVCIALGLQKNVIESYYSLQKSFVALHPFRQIPVATSLISAAIDEFLEHSTEELIKPDPGSDLSSIDKEDLLRRAGHRLMKGVVMRIDQTCVVGMHNIFHACNTITSLRYEKSPGEGSIILARKDHPAVEKKIGFVSSTKLSNYRASRKLLELASDDLPLYSNSEEILGLATLGDLKTENEDVFKIRILGHHYWELNHMGKPLMFVQYGLPFLPRPSFDEQKLRHDLPRIFKNISAEDVDNLVILTKEAEKEPRGTMLVILDRAEDEAKRLNTQGTTVYPRPLTPELLNHLTPIDGAVVLSPQGICYGIGMILDGEATDKGDPGRGARYNSAVRYAEAARCPCLIIIISEDGGVDFIPNLKPAIPRSKIDQTIVALWDLHNAEKMNGREYISLMDWLERHRFYLRQGDCDILNSLVPQLEEKFCAAYQSSVKFMRREFVPYPEMDEALFYASE